MWYVKWQIEKSTLQFSWKYNNALIESGMLSSCIMILFIHVTGQQVLRETMLSLSYLAKIRDEVNSTFVLVHKSVLDGDYTIRGMSSRLNRRHTLRNGLIFILNHVQ